MVPCGLDRDKLRAVVYTVVNLWFHEMLGLVKSNTATWDKLAMSVTFRLTDFTALLGSAVDGEISFPT
jgi:hypothetical protein